jgi:23S rRNA A1618 N6-methylase RlmF
MSKSLLNTLGRQITLGFGRQIGYRSAKQVEKEIAKKVIDPNSKFRKQIQKFTLPGNPKLAIQKMWTLIDGFMEEYEVNTSLFQSNYKMGDIEFIQKKLDRVQQMKLSDNELDSLEHLISIWDTIKIK